MHYWRGALRPHIWATGLAENLLRLGINAEECQWPAVPSKATDGEQKGWRLGGKTPIQKTGMEMVQVRV